jgi:ribonuclease G
VADKFDEVSAGVTVFGSPGLIAALAGCSPSLLSSRRDNTETPMTKELVISADRHETKVAILEDDQLVEIYFQRANEYSLAGSIHKGRVTRVLPGMQSAFVNLGLERDTFLYVSDFFEESDEYESLPEDRPEREGGRETNGGGRRFDRAPRAAEPRPPAEAEPAPEAEAPAVVEVEAPTVEAEEAAPAVPVVDTVAPEALRTTESGEPGGNRDRDRDAQGRRSRRRRNRGRGFPESKYASEVSAPPAHRVLEGAGEPAASPASTLPASDDDFLVLPGESLAKYQGPGIPALDPDEEDEIAAAQAEADALTGELRVSVSDGRDVQTRPEETESEREVEHVAALPEEPATAELAPEPDVAAPVAAEPAAAEPGAPVAPPLAAAEPVAQAALAGEIAPDAPETETEVLETAEASESDTVAGEAEAPPAEGGEAGPAAASASVRERGGRYPHRVSRRMRRKMRGGPPETRETREPVREAPPVVTAPPPVKPEPRAARPPEKGLPSITELLKEGQEIIVQIAKEPLGQKGARITSHIALPGRYVVYMPTVEHMGVSRKIASDEERLRLKRILQAHRAGIPGGYIMRTAGEGKSEDEIAADMSFLYNLWTDIRQKAEKKHAPALLHHDLDIVQRLLRDQLTENFKAIWVDNEDVYESVLNFVQRFQPALVSRVKMYTRPAPIFEAFSITSELEKALRPKVWLKSGGYIVLNQTEALVAIDVNTGKYVGKSNRLEDTIVKTNTDAVKEIVRQIRLRDLGGIIVVDFIDMDERKNRQKVMQTLEEAMRADRAPYKILQFNDFGLVAITRKRVKQSLERTLCAPCPYCEGAGYVKSPQTTIGEILQEAQKIVKAVEGEEVILRVNPEVAKLLKSHTTKYLEELESILRRPVLVKSDPLLHQEKFDLA